MEVESKPAGKPSLFQLPDGVFSVLHISDLHRDLSNELDNNWLISSLERDFEQFAFHAPTIKRPALCVVSGDLVFGTKKVGADGKKELDRQYAQAEELLVGLCDRLFEGDRNKIVILPGNHDVSYELFRSCLDKVEIPPELEKKSALVAELRKPLSHLRWSWEELCFFRINDNQIYQNRFSPFSQFYDKFYQGKRTFSLNPSDQHSVFDFPELRFSILAINSCYNNDPFRRSGAFHPTSIAQICQATRESKRLGWLMAAAWHHNLFGGPNHDDYLDVEVVQILIESGVALGFHGHQHLPECVDERYRIGPRPRKMTIVSAGTLCAGPRHLSPGIPRSYNIVEIDNSNWRGRVFKREMVNQLFQLPMWGPGHFNSTNKSHIDFEICKPDIPRSSSLDMSLILESADKLLGAGKWEKAADILETVKTIPIARPLLVRALSELGDDQRTIDSLWEPKNTAEVVIVGGAILSVGARKIGQDFLRLEIVSNSSDASIVEIARRLRERFAR